MIPELQGELALTLHLLVVFLSSRIAVFLKKIFEENPKMCYNIVVDEKIVFSSQMTAILTLIFSTKYMRDDF